MIALTPKVLEKEYYEYGISLSTTLSSMVELIGTAVAAAIIAVIGTSGAIYVDMTTFLLSALIFVFVNTKEQGLVKQKFDRKASMPVKIRTDTRLPQMQHRPHVSNP